MNAVSVDVPCISGGAGKKVSPAALGRDPLGELLRPLTGSPVGAPPTNPAKNRSSARHITPLGIPVVPPV